MENPKTTIEALLETEKTVGGIKIYPITLARYGLLEIVESPFVNDQQVFNILNLIPSLYIMATPIDVLKKYNVRTLEQLFEDAAEWAEELDPTKVSAAAVEIEEKIKTIFRVAPDASADDKGKHSGKKAQTAG